MIYIYDIYIFLLGTVLASFLNALMYRIESGFDIKEMLFTRSRCESCKRDLNWYELIPIFSWFIQGGKCLKCKKKLDIYHPFSELFLGLGFVLVFTFYTQYIWFMLFLCLLFMLSYSDFHTKSIPQTLTHITIGIGVIYFALNYSSANLTTLIYFAVLAGALYLINLYKKAFGFGDTLLFLFFALIFTPNQYIAFILLTIYSSALFSVFLIIKSRKNLKKYIPLVPFMTLAFVLTPLLSLPLLWFLN